MYSKKTFKQIVLIFVISFICAQPTNVYASINNDLKQTSNINTNKKINTTLTTENIICTVLKNALAKHDKNVTLSLANNKKALEMNKKIPDLLKKVLKDNPKLDYFSILKYDSMVKNHGICSSCINNKIILSIQYPYVIDNSINKLSNEFVLKGSKKNIIQGENENLTITNMKNNKQLDFKGLSCTYNKDIIKIDSKGNLTTLKPGSTYINISYYNKKLRKLTFNFTVQVQVLPKNTYILRNKNDIVLMLEKEFKNPKSTKDIFNKLKLNENSPYFTMDSNGKLKKIKIYDHSIPVFIKNTIDVSNINNNSNMSKFMSTSKLNLYLNQFNYYFTSDYTKLRIECFGNKEYIDKTDKTLEKADEIIEKTITPNMTDLQKEKALHDYVVKNYEYDYDNYLNGTIPGDSYSAYGLLINGKGVCASYADTMKLLLTKVGIECIEVSGQADNGSLGNHAWNIVKIDNKYYHLDATWDDPVPDRPNEVRYKYFNLSDDEISKDHIWDKNKYPKCN